MSPDPENSSHRKSRERAAPNTDGRSGLYLALISVHGLIRGEDMELGRDPDTGGQVKYVVELARALAEHPRVKQVDLLTRRVVDSKVDDAYAEEIEPLSEKARIVRIDCGPRRYLRKESLWQHLDSFADQTLHYFRREGKVPDVIHGHYADAGYVGANLASWLDVPFVFTGHSLGRVKRERLLADGLSKDSIEKTYNISRRIEAEEFTLERASFVVASTEQEIEEQYKLYDNYQPRRMVVIRPGVDLSRFSPPRRGFRRPPIQEAVDRFLHDRRKPMVLAISRPDPRKNVRSLIHAFGKNAELRQRANLVLVLGDREDIQKLDKTAREVLTSALLLIDLYDLHGTVAYPKHHAADDVPDLYRLAARSRGVFVNPALTEPFGLTLLEAAASGVPVVATNDGGPRDILATCRNGVLVDPLDHEGIGEALLNAITSSGQWKEWSRQGLQGAKKFGWKNHAKQYLKRLNRAIPKRRPVKLRKASSLVTADRVLVSDVDDTLTGDREALHELLEILSSTPTDVAFAIATGRHIDSALEELRSWGTPMPDILITSVGTEIYYGPNMSLDRAWSRVVRYRWQPDRLREALAEVPGISPQHLEVEEPYKISYHVDSEKFPSVRELTRRLRKQELHARLVYSHDAFLDVLPVRASKGHALRYLSAKWGIPLPRVIVAGGSGNDEEMLLGDTLGVVVANHSPELERLRDHERIFFASGAYARGIIEGLEHYNFLEDIRIPDEVKV